MLGSIFLLPFSNVASQGGQSQSLFSIFKFFIDNISSVQINGVNNELVTAYLYQLGFIMILAGSFVGLFPIGSGVLSVIGLSFITIGPYEVTSGYSFAQSGFSSGFYVIWALAIVEVMLGIWVFLATREKEDSLARQMRANASDVAASARVCALCGANNPPNATICINCRAPLR